MATSTSYSNTSIPKSIWHDSPVAQNLPQLLNETQKAVASGSIISGMERLFHGLQVVRQHSGESWLDIIHDTCRRHPLLGLTQQDPFTRRSFIKPRGYAGDAVMLDMIYGISADAMTAPDADLGARINQYTAVHSLASQAVRARRQRLGRMIDELASSNPRARVLSVAAGHFREAELSTAVQAGALQEFVALDQDSRSLAEIDRAYGRFGVKTVQACVRDLIRNRINLGSFDLIYAAGLFDYLKRPIAATLLSRLFAMLRPSGRLLIANFRSGLLDAAYMEAFMDWFLVYRTEEEVTELLDALPQADLHDRRVFADDLLAVIYGEVVRIEHE